MLRPHAKSQPAWLCTCELGPPELVQWTVCMAGCYSCMHQCKIFFFKGKKKEAKVIADGIVNATNDRFWTKVQNWAIQLIRKILYYGGKKPYCSKHLTAFQIIRQEKLPSLNS